VKRGTWSKVLVDLSISKNEEKQVGMALKGEGRGFNTRW